MALELNGTTGVSAVQAGSIQSDDLAAGVGGKVLQVASTLTSSSNLTITSSSNVDVPEMEVTIVPQKTNSLILVVAVFAVEINGSGDIWATFRIVNPSTVSLDGAGDFVSNRMRNTSGDRIVHANTLIGRDEPNTTSSITYRLQAGIFGGSSNLQIRNSNTGGGQMYAVEVSP